MKIPFKVGADNPKREINCSDSERNPPNKVGSRVKFANDGINDQCCYSIKQQTLGEISNVVVQERDSNNIKLTEGKKIVLNYFKFIRFWFVVCRRT